MHYKYGASSKLDQVERERELIRRIQSFDDRLAMKELTTLYQGALRTYVASSGIANTGMDMNTALNYAEKFLKRYAKQYDESKGVQPNTYFQNNITNQLKNVKNNQMETISHMSDELSETALYDRAASDWLDRMGVEPTPEASKNFIRNELEKGRAKMTDTSIARARQLTRREKSGDRSVGGEGEGDFMSQGEYLSSTTDKSSDDLLSDYQKKLEIQQVISGPEFSRAERKFLSHLAGIGEYAFNPTANKNLAALDAGIDQAQGIAAIKKLQEKMKGK